MRLLNADGVQFFAWNRVNKTCEKRRKFDVCKRIRRTYPRFAEKEGDYTGTAEYNAER